MIQDLVKTLLAEVEKNRANKVHTAVPGRVVEYDAQKGTATIQPLASTYFNARGVQYPLLYDVPIIFPRFGQIGLFGPVESNDEVLLIFTERGLGEWKYGDSFSEARTFSLQDAIAIPGFLYGAGNKSEQAQNNKSIIIKNGSVEVEIKADKINIKGDIVIDGTVTYVE